MKVTDIIFGDPVRTTATATEGTLEGELLSINRSDVTVSPNQAFHSGRMKVQWSQSGKPQKQVRRMVLVNDLVVAVHLDQK